MNRKDSRNISCDEALRRIFDYIDDHLGDKSRSELVKHLDMCRHCYDRVEFEKLLKSRLRRMKPGVSSGKLHKRIAALLDEF